MALSSLLFLIAGFSSQDADQYASARLLIDPQAQKAGEPVWVGVKMTMVPGWHVYWENPGDSGMAPAVDWTLPAGAKMEGPFFQAPHRIVTESETTFGYEGETVFLYRLHLPKGATGSFSLKGDASWLVCKDVCLPGSATLQQTIWAPVSPGAEVFEKLTPWVEALPTTFPASRTAVFAEKDGYGLAMSLRGTVLEGMEDFEFFPRDEGQFTSQRPATRVGNGTVRFALKSSEYLSSPLTRVRGLVVGRKTGTDGKKVEISVNIDSPVS